MDERVALPSGRMASMAQYHEFGIQEYDTNPYIQALPLLKSREEIIKCLSNEPVYEELEREHDSAIRLHLIQRIYSVFQPLPEHIKIWNMMNTLLCQGYLARNPFDTQYKRDLHTTGKAIIEGKFNLYDTGQFRTTASLMTIIGVSGMGKTVTVDRVLQCIEQIIVHSEYKEQHFSQIQFTWLKLEAPHNASLKALCLQFFMKIDDLLGTNNFKKYVSRNLSVDAMLPLMGKVAQNIGLGVLVLDELQHLVGKHAKQMMNFFVALTNTFGVPVVFIGTPAAYALFESEFRIARRGSGNGELIWSNMKNDDKFKLFMRGIWKYQWNRDYTNLDQEIVDAFYEETQGISDLVIKLFISVQQAAIETGREQITINLIKTTAKQVFRGMQKMLKAIKSQNPYQLAQYEDIQMIDRIGSTIKLNKNIINREEICTNILKQTKEISEEVLKEDKSTADTLKRKKISYSEEDLRRLHNPVSKLIGANVYEKLYELGYIAGIESWVN